MTHSAKYQTLLTSNSLALALLGVFLFGLSACGSATGYGGPTEPAQTAVPIVSTLARATPPSEMRPTSALSITPAPSVTPMSSITPTGAPIIPTPTLKSLLAGPLVAFNAVDASGNGYVLILDLSTTATRRLQWDRGEPVRISWWPDGCKLNVSFVTSSGHELVTVDLQGNELQTVFEGGDRADGSYSGWPVLSPDGKWVAYTVFSGDQGYVGSELQNIEVTMVNSQQQPFILTTKGGAWSAAWSPDSKYLAYSDYDNAGVAQLYRSRPDSSDRAQLTHFTTRGTKIRTIQWSPSGNRIGFVAYDENSRNSSIWIASLDSGGLWKAAVEIGDYTPDELWWSADGHSLAFYTQRSGEQGSADDALFWVDAAEGLVIHVLEALNMPNGFISLPFAIDGNQLIGSVGNERILIYHTNTGTFEEREYAIDWADLTGPSYAASAGFRGEANCQTR